MAERKGALRAALRHRDFRFLVAGQAVSGTGDWLYNVALIVYVLHATGSGAWIAAASVIRFLPYVLFGTFGGVVADRYDRKRVMIASDLGRGVIMIALTIVASAHGSASLAIALAAVSTSFSAFYLPCVNAATPALVGEDDLTGANAIIATVSNVTLALGPAVGGVLLLLGSPTTAFAVNAVTFLFSAGLTLPIRTKLTTIGDDEETPAPLRERLVQGFTAIRGSTPVLLLVALTVALCLTYGQEIVLYALAATRLLGIGEDGVAFMYAAIGVGGILAAGLTSRLGEHPKQGAILTVAGAVSAIPMMCLAFVRNPAVAYALLTLEGAAVIVVDVVAITMLQRLLAASVLGRVMGILDSLMVAGIMVGSVLAPLVVRIAGLPVALLFAGGLLLVFTGLVLPKARTIDRTTAARAAELAPRVDLLERLGLFEAASHQMLEALAAAASDERVLAGTVVIREGDEPDDLFAVVHGRLTVSSTGETGRGKVEAPEMAAGDYFGEIGLLERVPRTATVTAATDCDLLRISGEDFLRIVTQGPRVSGNVRAGIAQRLARTHPSLDAGHA